MGQPNVLMKAYYLCDFYDTYKVAKMNVSNETEDTFNFLDLSSEMEDKLSLIGFALIVVISLVGNSYVLYTILKMKQMSSTELMILNMTFSDLLITIINIPFSMWYMIAKKWIFGQILCKIVFFLEPISVYVSSLTMAVISVNRFQGIINASKKQLSDYVSTWKMITLIWFVSFLFALPVGLFATVIEIGDDKLSTCSVEYPSPRLKYSKIIIINIILTQYLIPLLIASYAYTRIGIRVWFRGQIGEVTSKQRRHAERSKKRTVMMLCSMIFVFSITWLPIHLQTILILFNLIIQNCTIFRLLQWLALSSVCYNPFIYFWFTPSSRKRDFKSNSRESTVL